MESKSVYTPPSGDDILLKKIYISPYNQNRIGLLIGKEGHNFIRITEKYDLLYIYFIDEHIEIYGKDLQNIYKAIHTLTNQIRILNYTKKMYYNVDNILSLEDCFLIDKQFTEKGGNQWLKNYNFPKEGEHLRIDEVEHVATDVGIFTFSLRRIEKCSD